MKSIKGLLVLFLFLTGLFYYNSCDETVTNQIIAQLVTHGWVVGDQLNGYGYILNTIDAGDNWTRQGDSSILAGIDLNDLAVIDKQTVFVVGTQGSIILTTDGGSIWQKQTTPTDVLSSNLVSVYALDRNNAWISGEQNVVLHTVNGGNTWDRITITGAPVNMLLQGICAADMNNIWGAGQDGSGLGYIYNSTDAGTTWNRINPSVVPPDSAAWIGVKAVSVNNVWVHGGKGKLIHTTDAGQTWTHVANPNQWFNDLNDMSMYDANIGYFACDFDHIMSTTNAGINWSSQITTSPPLNQFLVGVHTISSTTAWIVGRDASHYNVGKIIYTTNSGTDWILKDSTSTRLWKIAFVK